MVKCSLNSLEIETFRYLNSLLQNFDPNKGYCLMFITKKFEKQTKQPTNLGTRGSEVM